MFTSVREVKELTGREIEPTLLPQAQRIVESYVGRTESEVGGARDLELLGYATAYQAVYMAENADTVFTQVALRSVTQAGTTTSFDEPVWLAPLAKQACKGLSWRGSRSVRVGKTLQRGAGTDWWHD